MTASPPRFVVFDLDGTLLDGYDAITRTLGETMAGFGLEPWDAATVRRHVGRGLEALVADAVGEERMPEAVRRYRTRYPELYLDHSRLLPGVSGTVLELGRRGYRMGVATNKPARFSVELIRHFGLAGVLPWCWGPDRVTHPKPHPEMVERLLDEMGATPAEAVYVGDMTVDIETARASNLPVWVIPHGSSTRDELVAAAPDRILDRFEELLELLPPLG